MNKVYQFIYKKVQEKLKSYIKGGEIEEKTSLRKIEITLNNVHIKKSAFNSLQVPFSVHNTSKVKKIVISISHSPKLKLSVENLHIVINPAVFKHLNAQYLHNEKIKKLQQWEDLQRESLTNTGTYGKKFLDWLLPNVLSRVKIMLKNFTILYQDTQSLQIAGYPCLCIIKFNTIKIWRTDKDWKKEGQRDTSIYVMLEIKDLSITMKCDPVDFEKGTNLDKYYDEMRASERNYVLRPCSFEGKISISSENPQQSLINQILLTVSDEIHIAINEYQRMFIESFINFVDSSTISRKYAFLRPKVSIRNSPSEWWKFVVNAAKHDLRFNLINVFKMQETKEKYIEYYKRIQKVIQAPVLPKLSPQENEEMRDIEENLMYEEIINFRTQALEQIKNKISQDKNAYLSKHNNETVKKYLKEYYSDVIHVAKIDEESADETSEEVQFTEVRANVSLVVHVPRVVFSLQVLKALPKPEVVFLDNKGCDCGRCKPEEGENEFKPVENDSLRISKNMEVPERDLGFSTRKFLQQNTKGLTLHSLLPTRKMRDIAIEYGEEVFNVGPLCYKSRSNEPFEPNIMKESTLLFIIIDKISINSSGTKDVINAEISINEIYAIDPLVCKAQTLDSQNHDKVNRITDLLNYKGWLNYFFRECEENKALWSLRYFMRDLNALPELEFLLHYYELTLGRDLCNCNINLRNERLMQKEFILNRKNGIHVNLANKKQTNKRQATEKWDMDLMNDIACRIEKGLIEVFPYFLRAGLRYFISSIIPKSHENSQNNIVLKLARDRNLGKVLENYVILVEIGFGRVPLYITTTCVSTLKNFLAPQVALATPKSFHKSTFIATLEDNSEKMCLINSIVNNWDRSSIILSSLVKNKMMKIPKFTLELHFAMVQVYIFSLLSRDNFREPPQMVLSIKDIYLIKDVSPQIPDKNPIDKTQTINSLDFLNEEFLLLSINTNKISIKTTSKIFTGSLKAKIWLSAFKQHPTMPNVLIDVHIPNIFITLNSNIIPLLHIINSIEKEIISANNSQESSKYHSDMRQIDTDYIQEYRNFIYSADLKKKSKSLLKYVQDHNSDPKRCRHCLFKYIKLLSFITVTIGNMNENDDKGILIILDNHKEKMLEVNCKHLMLSVEEKIFSKRVALYISDVYGINSDGETITLHPGLRHAPMQPYIPIHLLHFFPLARDFYYESAEIPAFNILLVTQLCNSEIVNESIWDPSDIKHPEAKKSIIGLVKHKVFDIDLNENESKIGVFIDTIAVSISFTPRSKLVDGLKYLGKIFDFAKAVCPKPKKTIWVIKSLSEKATIKVKYVNLSLELGPVHSELICSDLEIFIYPATSSPPLTQLIFSKSKESEAIFNKITDIQIGIVTFTLGNLVKVCLKDGKIELNENRESKVKIMHKTIIATLGKIVEKISANFGDLYISSEDKVLVAIPGEMSRNSIIVGKNKNNIKLMGEVGEMYLTLPQVGICFEVKVVKEIVRELLKVIEPVVEKYNGFEDVLVKDKSLLVYKSSKGRVILNVNSIFCRLLYGGNLIMQLKLSHMYLHNNMCKGVLEKYLASAVKENFEAHEKIYSEPHELMILIKKVELLPYESVYENMVDMSADFSLNILVDTKYEKITVSVKKPARVIMINKVFEELLLSIKDIKSVIPKDPNKKPTPSYTLDCDIKGAELLIPRNSMSNDYLRAFCKTAKVSVFMGDKDLKRPTPINIQVEVYKNKEVLHDELEDIKNVPCDLVTVSIRDVSIETFINGKKKSLGKVADIGVDVCSPARPEQLKQFEWKSDSFVNIKFSNAEIKASMVKDI